MRPQDYRRRSAYRPPSSRYRRFNKTFGVGLTSLGLAPRDAVTLEVRGRRSGKTRRTPVLVTSWKGEDYVVSLAGESAWVRNVRAADGQAVIRRRRARPVRLIEVPVAERPEIIKEYLRRAADRGSSKAAAMQAQYYFGVHPDPSVEEVLSVARYYPVFRVAE